MKDFIEPKIIVIQISKDEIVCASGNPTERIGPSDIEPSHNPFH